MGLINDLKNKIINEIELSGFEHFMPLVLNRRIIESAINDFSNHAKFKTDEKYSFFIEGNFERNISKLTLKRKSEKNNISNLNQKIDITLSKIDTQKTKEQSTFVLYIQFGNKLRLRANNKEIDFSDTESLSNKYVMWIDRSSNDIKLISYQKIFTENRNDIDAYFMYRDDIIAKRKEISLNNKENRLMIMTDFLIELKDFDDETQILEDELLS